MTFFRLWIQQGQVVFVYAMGTDEIKHDAITISEPVGYKRGKPPKILRKPIATESWYFKSPKNLDAETIRKKVVYSPEGTSVNLPDEYESELIEVVNG